MFFPKVTASLLDWIKTTVRSVYPEKDYPAPSINAKWNIPDKQLIYFVYKPYGTSFMIIKIFTY